MDERLLNQLNRVYEQRKSLAELPVGTKAIISDAVRTETIYGTKIVATVGDYGKYWLPGSVSRAILENHPASIWNGLTMHFQGRQVKMYLVHFSNRTKVVRSSENFIV
jgi:hypothetical protein